MPTTPMQTTLTALEPAQAGHFAEIRELFASPRRPMVPTEALRAAWEAELDRQGYGHLDRRAGQRTGSRRCGRVQASRC